MFPSSYAPPRRAHASTTKRGWAGGSTLESIKSDKEKDKYEKLDKAHKGKKVKVDLKVKPADKKAGTGPTVTFTITADDNTVLATGTVFPPPMPAPATQPPFATSHPEGNGTKTDVGWHGTKPAWLHIYCPGKDEKGKSAHLQVFDDPTVEINLSEEDQTALIGFLKKHFVVKETAGAGETKPPK